MAGCQNLSKNKQWESRVLRWKASGKSARQWCKEHNVAQSTFQYWRDRYFPEKLDPKAFTEIPLEISTGIAIRYQGFEIQVEKGFDQQTLSRCLRAIKSCPC